MLDACLLFPNFFIPVATLSTFFQFQQLWVLENVPTLPPTIQPELISWSIFMKERLKGNLVRVVLVFIYQIHLMISLYQTDLLIIWWVSIFLSSVDNWIISWTRDLLRIMLDSAVEDKFSKNSIVVNLIRFWFLISSFNQIDWSIYYRISIILHIVVVNGINRRFHKFKIVRFVYWLICEILLIRLDVTPIWLPPTNPWWFS